MDRHALTCDICRALEHHGDTPLERIRATRARREHLASLEEEAVRAARGAGHSWEEVATALGTSRQAAWQRWRRPSSKKPAPEPALEPAQEGEAS